VALLLRLLQGWANPNILPRLCRLRKAGVRPRRDAAESRETGVGRMSLHKCALLVTALPYWRLRFRSLALRDAKDRGGMERTGMGREGMGGLPRSLAVEARGLPSSVGTSLRRLSALSRQRPVGRLFGRSPTLSGGGGAGGYTILGMALRPIWGMEARQNETSQWRNGRLSLRSLPSSPPRGSRRGQLDPPPPPFRCHRDQDLSKISDTAGHRMRLNPAALGYV